MPSPPATPAPKRSSRKIDKLDFDTNRPSHSSTHEAQRANSAHGSHLLRDDGSFFSEVVEGVIERDRRKMRQKVIKYFSFASAILSCLCAGSITAYSLYGPLFLRHLKYSQYQVNLVSTTAEVALYLPVPFVGWACDRYNVRPISAFSGVAFGLGYALAACVYRAGPIRAEYKLLPGEDGLWVQQEGWPFGVMVFAFVCIGIGTLCMYLTAVTTCAKNFGRGKHKGVALAIPIAAFGLSGMWQSQVGSYFFKDPDAEGNVDVYRYFCFLAGLLFVVGLIGSVGLRVVGEEELIEEGVEELERSGGFEETRSLLRREVPQGQDATNPNYGATETDGEVHEETHLISTDHDDQNLDPQKTSDKKKRLLNAETLLFLSDPTAYFLAAGFFLTSGPGETYFNNIGTLIHTLYPPHTDPPKSNSPATHVAVIALASTLARLATGVLADFFAPMSGKSKVADDSDVDTISTQTTHPGKNKFTLPRPAILLGATVLFSIGQLILATPVVQRFPGLLPFTTALVGLGYGAIFSLTPIIISVVWGVQNFGTNWGIIAVVPAPGAAIWGVIYSAVYSAPFNEHSGDDDSAGNGDGSSVIVKARGGGEECYGSGCYQISFAAMTVASWIAIVLWVFAWRRWRMKGVAV